MSDCCEVPKTKSAERTPCPRCGAVGLAVADETLVAILGPDRAVPLLPVARRFCRTARCPVVYYGASGLALEKKAMPVRVGMKEADDPIPLCYCFGFSRADVRREVAETGESTVPARITAEVKAGRCACEVKNPSGQCCLGEVSRAVREAKTEIGRAGVASPRRDP